MKTYRHIAAVAAMLSAAPALADMTPAEQQATLAAHNTERANYPGVGALMWAPLLAQFAQQWAQSLADRNAWEHRSQSTLPSVHPTTNPFRPGEWVGENLFRGGWPPSDPNSMGPAAVALWIAEKQWYHRDLDDGLASAENKPPGCTAPAGNYCGHFTQVVWSRTQFVGCGKATATPEMGGRTYIVCNYYPAGNYSNQFPY